MKKILPICICSMFFFATMQTTFISCTKTNNNTKIVMDTVTVVQRDTTILRDTTIIKDTALTAAILTANSWKFQEVRAESGNTPLFYLRGASGNSLSLDNAYFTFNSNNTGLFVDNLGNITTLVWNFTDASNKKMIWTWNLTTPVTVTWENIFYKNASISYTESYDNSGTNVVSANILTVK